MTGQSRYGAASDGLLATPTSDDERKSDWPNGLCAGVPGQRRDSIVQPKSEDRSRRRSKSRPTEQMYGQLELRFRYFNRELFDGRLSPVMWRLSGKQQTLGYYKARSMENRGGVIVGEIGINPAHFEQLGDEEVCKIIVQTMVCHYRETEGRRLTGKGISPGYTDRLQADLLESLGLRPRGTDGKRTGYRVTVDVIARGPFDMAYRELAISERRLEWRDHVERLCKESAVPPSSDRIKFTCPACGLNAWAKPSAQLGCRPCGLAMVANPSKVKSVVPV